MSPRVGWRFKYIFFISACSCLCSVLSSSAGQGSNDAIPSVPDSAQSQPADSAAANQSEIKELQRQLAEQQKEIEQLRVIIKGQTESAKNNSAASSARTQTTSATGSSRVGDVASMTPVLPSGSAATPCRFCQAEKKKDQDRRLFNSGWECYIHARRIYGFH